MSEKSKSWFHPFQRFSLVEWAKCETSHSSANLFHSGTAEQDRWAHLKGLHMNSWGCASACLNRTMGRDQVQIKSLLSQGFISNTRIILWPHELCSKAYKEKEPWSRLLYSKKHVWVAVDLFVWLPVIICERITWIHYYTTVQINHATTTHLQDVLCLFAALPTCNIAINNV